MAALAASILVVGFSFNPGSSDATHMKRWTMPILSDSSEGLGGGIAFAVEPEFCSKVMEIMEDSWYSTCDHVEAAVMRAFETWASNHADISFVNVTEACTTDPAVVACLADTSRTYLPGNCTKACSAAEVFILAEYVSSTADPVPILVTQYKTTAVDPSVTGGGDTSLDTGPRSTMGQTISQDLKIEEATIVMNLGQCGYLDDTFCYGMHEMESKGISAVVVFSLLMMPPWAFVLVVLTIRLIMGCHNCYRMKQGTGRGPYEGSSKLPKSRLCSAFCGSVYICSTPMCVMVSLLMLAILCPYVYFNIAEPCTSCFSFEASMVQATGQVLGLTDPSLPGSVDYKKRETFSLSNCADSAGIGYAKLNVDRSNYTDAGLGNGPVMLTPSKIRGERCPSQDDLDGLNFLYPTCSHAHEVDPTCVRSSVDYGVMQFAVTVLLGWLLSMVVVVLCAYSSQYLSERCAVEVEEAPRVRKTYPPVEDAPSKDLAKAPTGAEALESADAGLDDEGLDDEDLDEVEEEILTAPRMMLETSDLSVGAAETARLERI